MKQDRQPGTDAYKTVVTVGNCCGEGGDAGVGRWGEGGRCGTHLQGLKKRKPA